MSSTFTIDQLPKSQTIDPNSINRLCKINMMLNFIEIRSKNPRMTQNQICKQLGTSDSTNKRYRDDIDMDSPYKRNNYKKKTTKRKTDTNITSPQEPHKNENSKSTTNQRSKSNVLKVGNVSDTHTLTGKEIFNQTFQIDKANCISENKQEDNKQFFTIAKKNDKQQLKTQIIV